MVHIPALAETSVVGEGGNKKIFNNWFTCMSSSKPPLAFAPLFPRCVLEIETFSTMARWDQFPGSRQEDGGDGDGVSTK